MRREKPEFSEKLLIEKGKVKQTMVQKKHTFLRLIFALGLYFFLLLLLSVVEGNVENSNIKNFPDALWYSMVTLTTVGYGDYYPVTATGRFLALMFILGSLGLLSYIIGRATETISEIGWKRKMGFYGTAFENHVVIIGWDDFSNSITRQLTQADNKIAIITADKDIIDLIQNDFPSSNVFTLFCDMKNIESFKNANIDKASMVFVNLKDDTEKLITVLNIKKAFPTTKFIVALDNADLTETFYSGGASFVLSKNEIASKLMASYIFEPDVADMTNDLLTISQSAEDYDIKEFKVMQDNPYAGKHFGEIFAELKSKYNVVAIGVCKLDKEGKRKIFKLPPNDLKLEINDYLIVIMSGKESDQIKELFKTGEGVLCHKS